MTLGLLATFIGTVGVINDATYGGLAAILSGVILFVGCWGITLLIDIRYRLDMQIYQANLHNHEAKTNRPS